MCGEDAAKKIENNLKKYSSKILEHAGLTTPDAGQFTERDMILVLEAIDKCVKPSNIQLEQQPHSFPNTMYVIIVICMHDLL